MDTEVKSDDSIKTLYKEAAENHRYVVEWRHKILIRFFLAMAAFFYVAKWMWETSSTTVKAFAFIPLLLSALASLGFLFIERRNTEIMHINDCVDKVTIAAFFKQKYQYMDIILI